MSFLPSCWYLFFSDLIHPPEGVIPNIVPPAAKDPRIICNETSFWDGTL
jgi:hypothetical protein